MLGKTRLEALSDGVFAIVMTLLVFNIKVPALPSESTTDLLAAFNAVWPLFTGYIVTFIVLAMLWLSHNYFYSVFATSINRQLVMLNMLYLALIGLIPFFADLLGTYVHVPTMVCLYGFQLFLIGLLNNYILRYAINSHDIDTDHVSTRTMLQARIRSMITPAFTFLGMLMAFVSIPLALALYAFPILFNIIPGTLNFLEKIFGFELGK